MIQKTLLVTRGSKLIQHPSGETKKKLRAACLDPTGSFDMHGGSQSLSFKTSQRKGRLVVSVPLLEEGDPHAKKTQNLPLLNSTRLNHAALVTSHLDIFHQDVCCSPVLDAPPLVPKRLRPKGIATRQKCPTTALQRTIKRQRTLSCK